MVIDCCAQILAGPAGGARGRPGAFGVAAEAGGFERALDASGSGRAGHGLVTLVVGVLFGDELERDPGGDAADPGLLVDGLVVEVAGGGDQG